MKTVDPKTAELLQSYTEEEWLTWYNALVIIAKRICRRRYWRTGEDGVNLPEGYSPEAIVQEAIARLFGGTRQWNRIEYPGDSPMGILRATVKSIIGDLVRSEEHKRYAYLESSGEDKEGGGDNAERLIHRSHEDVQQFPASPERILFFRSVISRIRERIEDRADLMKYFDYLLQELKRGEIAEELKVSGNRVDELRKQFLSRTEDIYSELFGDTQRSQKKGARKARN